MDSFALSSTAAHLQEIPGKDIPATDKLRLAWHLLADAFRHPHLKTEPYSRLRQFVTPTYHARYSEPIAFLDFATAVSGHDDAYGNAIDSTGFRDNVCNQAILAVADWVESIADRVDDVRAAGYLGLIVDEGGGDVRRQNYPAVVHFEPGSAELHMVGCAWKAGAAGVTSAAMSRGYPGDAAPHARKLVKQNVNTALAVLGVRLAPNKPPLLEVIPG